MIKAHRHRKLSFQEISIVNSRGVVVAAETAGKRYNLNAVIDPPTRSVQMDDRVAMLRGLRGFRGDEEEADIMTKEAERADPSMMRKPQGRLMQWESLRIPRHGLGSTRRSFVRDEDRRIAELSITHEDTVAAAVCMAYLDPSEETIGELEPIVDDGTGESIHEPAWGDRGFNMAGTIKVAS